MDISSLDGEQRRHLLNTQQLYREYRLRQDAVRSAAGTLADRQAQSMLDGGGSVPDSGRAQFADHMLDTAAGMVAQMAGRNV